jgi:putative ABC transport system ATP-binding protein
VNCVIDAHLAGKRLSSETQAALADSRRDHVGFVFQSYNLIPVLNVSENVEYVLMLKNVPTSERKLRVTKALEDVGMAGFEKRFPSQLSGGQQQRVAVARALVSKPDIILADEPTANLDSKTGESLINLLENLNRSYGVTILFLTHDPHVLKRAHRVVTLHDGEIVADERREA